MRPRDWPASCFGGAWIGDTWIGLIGLALAGMAVTGSLIAAPLAIRVQRSPLAGLVHHGGPDLWAGIRTGDRVDLVREPANPHDARAVRVDWQGVTLGYLPRRDNDAIAWALDRGERPDARVHRTGETRTGRPRFEIELRLR
jgi:hypothetical protein